MRRKDRERAQLISAASGGPKGVCFPGRQFWRREAIHGDLAHLGLQPGDLIVAVIPLALFSRRRDLMGELVNHWLTTNVAWVVTALIVALNLYLLYQTLLGGE
jgi:hypothetical protein